ncbi:sensor histidine kinase [Alkalihalobacillus sp. 1P02AB]|uniref:sensor histidine kinase n=1 Tax=Alkalihalobacillus sp. 1P02AB TaxID=3132260 RepID=UPI0039A5DEED
MKKWFYHLSLRIRMVLYFAFVIILAISLASIFIYIQAANQIKQQAENHLEQIVENISFQTERYIRDLELATLTILMDRKVRSFLDLKEDQPFERYMLYRDILSEMNKVEMQNSDINLLYIIGENHQYILSDGSSLMANQRPVEEVYEHLLETTVDSGGVSLLANQSLNKNEYVLSITRRIRGATSFIPKGVLGIEVDASALEQLWNLSRPNNDIDFVIVGGDERIVYHQNPQLLGKKIDEELVEKMEVEQSGSFHGQWDLEEMLFYHNKSMNTGWTLLAMTPVKSVLEPVSGIQRSALLASVIALVLALGISQGFARSIVVPLKTVQQGMKKVETGEWRKIKELKGSDEMSSMVNSYNMMVERLSQLVEDLYASELRNQEIKLEKQKTELQALQSQINPHFLHNTLETMNAYAVLNESEEISEMAEALSNMFRYSIRNFEVVTIKDELDHIKNFLIVQQHRFQEKIDIDYDIAESLLREDIVKLTLQPLVENSIHHGLRKRFYQGNILIRARCTDELLYIDVMDNGSGISEERLDEIRQKLSSESVHELNQHMGIGVNNVHRRIQLIFGQEYGLKVTSEVEQGTTVTMTIPRKSFPHKQTI